MAFLAFTSAQMAAKAPWNETKTQLIRTNFDDIQARLLAVEAGGGTGAGSALEREEEKSFGFATAGMVTNEAKLFRRRYHFEISLLTPGSGSNPIDFKAEGGGALWMGVDENFNLAGTTINVAATRYRGENISIPKSSAIVFHLPIGKNAFSIGSTNFATSTDSLTVTVDDVSITSAFIVDENKVARSDTYSTNSATTFVGNTEFFFGGDLDHTKDQIIRVENTDSAAKEWQWEFVEIAFRSNQVTINRTIDVEAGKANIRGSIATFSEAQLTFSASVGHGYCGSIIGATAGGAPTLLEGVEGAMTQCTPEKLIAFSSAVTSLEVKNLIPFENTGFLLGQNPYGQHSILSYTSKTGDILGTFNQLNWDSQPVTDFTPLDNFSSTTVGDATGDYNLVYWASGGHVIDGTNNKLDFTITLLNTAPTSHTATLTQGLFSADLVSLGKNIIDAMDSVKPLAAFNAEYFCEYCIESHLWEVGVRGADCNQIDYTVDTGPSTATSVMSLVMGYSGDQTGNRSYTAGSEIESLAHRVYRGDDSFKYATDTIIKYNQIPGSTGSGHVRSGSNDYIRRLGFPFVHFMQSAVRPGIVKIFTDLDASGMSLHFLTGRHGTMFTFSIDDGQELYLMQTQGYMSKQTTTVRGQHISCFIAFPRGSRWITIKQETETKFQSIALTEETLYLGCRQQFHKPKWEALTTSQAIIASKDIAPPSLYKTPYDQAYSEGTNDNIDTITVGAGYTTDEATDTEIFNKRRSFTSTNGSVVDIVFTTGAVAGGGISILMQYETTGAQKMGVFLEEGAGPLISTETGTRIQNVNLRNSLTSLNDLWALELKDLKASTQYVMRFKHEDAVSAGLLIWSAIGIISGDIPDPGNTATDITNTGQSPSFPINVHRFNFQRDSEDRTPARLEQTGFREGEIFTNYSVNVPVFSNFTNEDNIMKQPGFFSAVMDTAAVTNELVNSFYFCRAVRIVLGCREDFNNDVEPSIDGRTNSSNFSTRIQVKGGQAPAGGSTRFSDSSALYTKRFKTFGSADMSSNVIQPMTDTRGITVGDLGIVTADGQVTLLRSVTSIVADTSITYSEPISGFATYTLSNNVAFSNPGFHNIKLRDVAALATRYEHIEFEPMEITESNDERRRTAKSKVGEVASKTFRQLANLGDAHYPTYKDGRPGHWGEASISLLAKSAATSHNIAQDLTDIQVGAGTLDIKVTCTRRF